jgi:regulatory protein
MALRRGASRDHDRDRDEAAGAPPDQAELRQAALSYLARYASTQAALARVLDKRIDTWARKKGSRYEPIEQDRAEIAAAVATAKALAREVVTAMAQAGAVSDAAYAEVRASSLRRTGRSRRGVIAALAAKGVDADTARTVLENEEVGGDAAELTAAVRLARKRRVGPFRTGVPPEPPAAMRELAILARAGFAQNLARQVLAMDRGDAEALLEAPDLDHNRDQNL